MHDPTAQKKHTARKTTLSVSIEKTLVQRVQKAAKGENRSLSNYVATLLRKEMENSEA